jgi:hypothetical protein
VADRARREPPRGGEASMSSTVAYALVATLVITLAVIYSRWRTAVRAEFIRQYRFPQGLFEKLQKKRPGLSLKDCQLVALGLRRFFLTYLKGKRSPVSMPSQIVDDLWHEFILYTKLYENFCGRAFGRFMHHTPAIAMGTVTDPDAGMRRCWWHACREESINPRKPTRLPLLFAMDAKLNIEDGFLYALDCDRVARKTTGDKPIYCGGDFALMRDRGGGCGGGSGCNSSDSSCSGGGCSGGCGGGD